MSRSTRTWWGQRFLQALENCTDEGRLRRGRSYNSAHRLLAFKIAAENITATIRGNANPYFGVDEEPHYEIEINLQTLSSKDWQHVIERLAVNAGWLSRLLLNEMPESIEEAFTQSNHSLLPSSEEDLLASCSCPDWANPCKHIAGAYYHVASLLDNDPLLLFQLRGLSKEKLRKQLVKTPLGQALASQLAPEKDLVLEPEPCRYHPTPRVLLDKTVTHYSFWAGGKFPEQIADEQVAGVPALTIKKQGDYPPFWKGDKSFIEVMEAFYERVRRQLT